MDPTAKWDIVGMNVNLYVSASIWGRKAYREGAFANNLVGSRHPLQTFSLRIPYPISWGDVPEAM